MDNLTTETNDGWNYVRYSNGVGAWGFCRFDVYRGYIDFISVYPHNQKIGTQVLAKAEGVLRDHGHKVVKLAPLVGVEGFYKKNGYFQSWWDIWRPHVWRKRL